MRLVVRFMKPYWGLFAVTTVLLFADVIGALIIPTFAAELLNESATHASFDAMVATAAKMGAAALVSGLAAVAGGWCCSQLTSKVGKDMRVALYNKSLDLSIYDFRNFGTASITTRTINDVVNIQMAMTNVMGMLLPVPVIFAIALTLSFRLDVTMSLWLLAAIAFVCVVAWFIMRTASPLFRRLQKLLDRIGAVLLENLTGVRVIRAFGKERHEQRRMDDTFADYATTSIKANRLFANLDGLSYFGMNAFIVVVYFLAGGRISAGGFRIGDITAIVEYAIMALFYLMMAQMVIMTLPRALECCERVRLVLDHDPQIADPAPGDAVDMSGRGPLDDGEVLAFRDVTFRFADAQEDALSHVDFVCRKGQITAIIGGTGSGKSTIAMLALRFHDASWGKVTLDGVDVRDMTQRDLRSRIAYVQQQAWLFSGTIAENLRYGDKDATDRELNHALEVAQADEFVDSLPDGLDSRVAQGGMNFSGGQKQRLSIARALVGDAQIVVFDDSFSALDFKTDAALRHALAAEMGDRAVLIIAQRVSTIQHADQIIVLSDGRVAGLGRHDDLMETCDVYREIVESQTKEPSMGEEA
ncbi:ABC transporter ATP-binding protein [Bifidobacterium scardovii]|uniref:ABC transporter permease/ATP-binding protein n=1 Tax=Bifidobacterium scardovii TaxID=158787 RepID=A0A087D741_9BIFI|nr:ABC transporter ATP-binding protein [Bifidobacterium scardovii]KFI91341.1 ABC transporter permease/ATP-binding protein [Bifidobacterium scardovii]MDK6350295.1 ABC transporter ATP-binding protein [Bifidobacterium scardovii]MDU2422545.1 ABC transporter ATP-binding protein [Bifidobacterium scardovii]MDU8982421.1 ABC transporter ATP-binding protein [Bifidobacterium scardovii]BAQ30903.1 putative ABC transporter permease and ATP-binding components [Bifidobacterium scardovii JCM 12489 = DSM 13734]